MPYRRYGLILVFLLSSGQAFCQETANVEFVRGLNDSISQIDLSDHNAHEGLFIFPGAYFSRKNKIYAGLGFMIDSVELLQKYEDEEEQILHQADTLMRFALYFRRKKTNITFFFSYHKDKSWGISFKIRL